MKPGITGRLFLLMLIPMRVWCQDIVIEAEDLLAAQPRWRLMKADGASGGLTLGTFDNSGYDLLTRLHGHQPKAFYLVDLPAGDR